MIIDGKKRDIIYMYFTNSENHIYCITQDNKIWSNSGFMHIFLFSSVNFLEYFSITITVRKD